jgi:methylthioribose-1-phosphate isomerase
VIADNAGGHLMQRGEVDLVLVGTDRVSRNGDVANKIGTFHHAIAARHHGVKVMVVAPSSTVDMAMPSGADIHIEERDPAELLGVGGNRHVAEGVAAFNPVFDVTPAALIDALVTEKGVILAPDTAKMRTVFGG